jgi:hypothetical protein
MMQQTLFARLTFLSKVLWLLTHDRIPKAMMLDGLGLGQCIRGSLSKKRQSQRKPQLGWCKWNFDWLNESLVKAIEEHSRTHASLTDTTSGVEEGNEDNVERSKN